ncbi:MAG: hypothetical protein HUJ72_01300 [Blautia sp.]|nr:hypothetical protein [Blautia sp.]
MEIERKFWLERFPEEYPEVKHLETDQGYLAWSPVSVRIRQSHDLKTDLWTYILCIKSKGLLSRHEVETPITKEQFAELSSMLDRPLVHKDYHAYQMPDGNILECSEVDHGVFSYAEVEFSSEEEANAWNPPSCLGKELTYLSGFTMGSYYLNGKVPEIE